MYTLDKLAPESETCAKTCKEKLSELLELLPLEPERVTLSAGLTLYEEETHRNKIFIVRDGVLKFSQDDKLLYFLDEGDLLSIELLYTKTESKFFAEFAVHLDQYDADAFFNAICAAPERFHLWNQYLSAFVAWNSRLLRVLSTDEAVFSPSILVFSQGDVMVEEGAQGDQVFTLMEGKADVIVGGAKVGEILEEEMFGAVSLLTEQPTMASVVAASDCMVVQLSKDEFMNLVQTRPDTIFKLANDLSRAIMALNEQVLEKTSKD